MASSFPIVIDDKEIQVDAKQTILEVCRKNGIEIPTLCFMEGLSAVGACRLCLVEIEGAPKLFPACTTTVAPKQKIRTNTQKLQDYRRMIIEFFFLERNHVCAVCVANNHCELQKLAYSLGMDHVRFPYLYPSCHLDASHEEFVMDHNRCIMCTRCVRVCDEVEGAHNWDVMGRGVNSRIIADFNQPWGESVTCTSCGKCAAVCPTGAIWPKDFSKVSQTKNPAVITELVAKRKGNAP